MCSDLVQDPSTYSQTCVVQFYVVIFISPYSAFLGSQYIYIPPVVCIFPLLAEKMLFYQTNTGNFCEYSGLVQYNFHPLKRFSLDFMLCYLWVKKKYIYMPNFWL